MSSESSLTNPHDRNKENKWKPETSASPLSQSETKEALKELNDTNNIDKFPKVDRVYADPAVPMQNVSLFSFVPSKGAKPDKNGIYGFGKIRGCFNSPEEANQRAEFLIRNVDSHHQIFHTFTGKPFPITLSSQFSSKVDEINLKKEMTKAISEDLRSKKLKEKREIEGIKEKEKKLLESSERARKDDGVSEIKHTEEEEYEEYITKKVKLAQLSYLFLTHLEKLHEVKDLVLKTRSEVEKMDKENTTFKDKYFEKYMDARKAAGIKETKEEQDKTFMRFMVKDAKLPTIDTEETLPSVPK